VINFWASWCVPCAKEAPLLRAAARAHEGQVAFLGIDINDFKSDARHFLRKYKVNYVSLRDNSGSTQERYGLTGVPETYYLNAEGRIVAHSPGQLSRDDLEQSLAQAIGAEC
jgi:cytochrome c biogenesis protein CcmG, thiol:disulfide interchange protein DsbE